MTGVSHDRYCMDKVGDHLLVMKGDGELQDYPGNYSDYREWRELKEAEAKGLPDKTEKTTEVKTVKVKTEKAPKLNFKEREELKQLESDLPALEAEKAELEAAMSSGTLTNDELLTKGQRMQEVIDLLDEKEMRWLELSEKA